MILHDSGRGVGGKRSSSTGTWAVEFDGPSHFLKSRAPTGHLLKRRHLELLGHALVTVPDWEWEGCKGVASRKGGPLLFTSVKTAKSTGDVIT